MSGVAPIVTADPGLRPGAAISRPRSGEEPPAETEGACMPMDDFPAPTVHLDRLGMHSYVAPNDAGAQVRVGAAGTPDHFTPGELLRLALAACTVLSADHTLASRLGRDFDASADVTAAKADEGDRYERILVRLATDFSALEPQRRAALVERAASAIDRLCGVGRTLRHPAPLTYDI